jgi:hypothetical protein
MESQANVGGDPMQTGHVQLLLSYVLAGDVEESDYAEWVRGAAVPWWQDQPGFRAIRGYYTVVGAGARIIVQIDIDHFESLTKILASNGYAEMRRELNRFALDIDSRILAPTGRTPD